MNILLTTVSPGLDSEVDPRFGRGATYLVVDPDTLKWQAFDNLGVKASGGAGVQAAQFAVEHHCEAAISGDFGPNAYDALKAAGIPMYLLGSSRTAREVVERFKSAQLEAVGAPTSAGHHGQGRHG